MMPHRRVLITGAGRGIGAAIAQRYSDANWTVVAPSRAELDLADEGSLESFINSAGEFDALINNAAENVLGSIEDLETDALSRMIDVNLVAVWKLTRRFAPAMRSAQWGRIVNIASIYGIKSRASRGAYTLTKAGVIGLTKTAAIEYGPANVLVNAVAPGFVDTEMTHRNNSSAQIAELCRQVPLQRMARPEEIAALVYWVGSEENSYVSGQTIVIDGGLSAT
jgi:3-oxoacyl-[acyl-carrier protein] reductase